MIIDPEKGNRGVIEKTLVTISFLALDRGMRMRTDDEVCANVGQASAKNFRIEIATPNNIGQRFALMAIESKVLRKWRLARQHLRPRARWDS